MTVLLPKIPEDERLGPGNVYADLMRLCRL